MLALVEQQKLLRAWLYSVTAVLHTSHSDFQASLLSRCQLPVLGEMRECCLVVLAVFGAAAATHLHGSPSIRSSKVWRKWC